MTIEAKVFPDGAIDPVHTEFSSVRILKAHMKHLQARTRTVEVQVAVYRWCIMKTSCAHHVLHTL